MWPGRRPKRCHDQWAPAPRLRFVLLRLFGFLALLVGVGRIGDRRIRLLAHRLQQRPLLDERLLVARKICHALRERLALRTQLFRRVLELLLAALGTLLLLLRVHDRWPALAAT